MRFGKIITIHGVENNICECFPHIRYLHLNGVVLCSHFIRDVSEQTFKPERASAPRVHTSHTQKTLTITHSRDVFMVFGGNGISS